jgi:hypothetical protein
MIALLAMVLFCNAAEAGTNPEFKQTPLHGKLAKVKLAMNQPLSVWQSLDGLDKQQVRTRITITSQLVNTPCL